MKLKKLLELCARRLVLNLAFQSQLLSTVRSTLASNEEQSATQEPCTSNTRYQTITPSHQHSATLVHGWDKNNIEPLACLSLPDDATRPVSDVCAAMHPCTRHPQRIDLYLVTSTNGDLYLPVAMRVVPPPQRFRDFAHGRVSSPVSADLVHSIPAPGLS